MRRQIAAFAILAALLVSSSGFFTPRDIVAHTLASTVLVQSVDPEDNKPMTCTGVMVAARRALTAAHCVKDDAGFIVDGEDAMVMARGESLLLVSTSSTKKPLKLAKDLRIQEPVLSFGFAWGEMTVLGRHVAVLHGPDFATDGPIAPGMSGGPMVNASGELVGINQASNEIIGIACGTGEIREFLTSTAK